jgi:hypothetical protein
MQIAYEYARCALGAGGALAERSETALSVSVGGLGLCWAWHTQTPPSRKNLSQGQ